MAKNTFIQRADLSKNEITDEFAEILAKNKSIWYLLLRRSQIGDRGAIALAKMENLRALDLGEPINEVGVEDEGAIALAGNKNLLVLRLEDNSVGDDGAKALAFNTFLRELILSWNPISREAAGSFFLNTILQKLDLSETEGEDIGILVTARNRKTMSLGERCL